MRKQLVRLLNHEFGVKVAEITADWLIANGVAIPVRCKDCVKRETVLCPLETYDDFPWRASREDDFCSYGERKGADNA